jgi:putative SOS response-associated peptidase YedK
MFGHNEHHGVAPVSYILEWSDVTGTKTPYRIERADGAAMAVPALTGHAMEHKQDRAFSLVTIEPNEFVAKFHDRMIGQLDDEQIDTWLKPEEHTKAELWECLVAPPNEELVAYPLAENVGSAKFNDAKAMEAVGEPISWADVATKKLKGPAKARQATL